MNWLRHPRLKQCAQVLAGGGVVAYPTEAVWGLGCDPFNTSAIEEVLRLKQRAPDKGLILVAADIEQFGFLLSGLNSEQQKSLQQGWPGHTTWLVPHNGRVPSLLSGTHKTVALRVSAHPLVRALCLLNAGPIVSTSANPQALLPARNSLKVRCYFGDTVFYSPSAPATESEPSVIKDLLSGKQLR